MARFKCFRQLQHRALHRISNVRFSETADSAVSRAQRETSSMSQSVQYTPMQKLAISARMLAEEGHGHTLSGQITLRSSDNNGNLLMWVNPYGKSLELVTDSDFILVDGDMNVVNGEGFPNRATRFHYHVYKERPDIQCLIHTHPPKVIVYI